MAVHRGFGDLFELGYVATLAGALQRGDLSVVYPLARGSAPVLVLAVSAGVLGAATSAWQITGVALVAWECCWSGACAGPTIRS